MSPTFDGGTICTIRNQATFKWNQFTVYIYATYSYNIATIILANMRIPYTSNDLNLKSRVIFGFITTCSDVCSFVCVTIHHFWDDGTFCISSNMKKATKKIKDAILIRYIRQYYATFCSLY